MTFSQDTFDFFVYEFATETAYNSCRLVQHKRYAIALQEQEITRDDVSRLFEQTQIVPEPQGISLPQANSFSKIVDLLSLLSVKDLTKDEITENYQFNERQTNYYTDAARYLGLVNKFTDPDQEIIFTLTDDARQLFRKRPKQKYLGLIRKILEHDVYYKTFQATRGGRIPTKQEISPIIKECQINISGDTVGRRASTVHSWIKWIWDQID